ncbi:MAG: hypothetical protein K6L75_13560 [Cellvibrionaceae bacterium]
MSPLARAQSDCTLQAKTELEKLFCKIQVSSEARTLPSFSDFRKNSSKVQAALLKAPARRLNLPMPKIANTKKKNEFKTSAFSRSAGDSLAPARKLRPDSSANRENRSIRTSGDLVGCDLLSEAIECGARIYKLSSNTSNKNLRSGALSEENKMLMKSFQGDRKNINAVKNYLYDAYLQYIEKMLDIGLGASTMSFTKFYYTFYDLQDKNQDFSSRFEKMFGFLKKDKSSMTIKSRYTDSKPDAISQCAALSHEIIVCDQKEINWVFVKK